MWVYLLVNVIVGALIGGLVIFVFGKKVMKVEGVTYFNSFLVCLISTLSICAFWYLGTESFAKELVMAIFRKDGGALVTAVVINLVFSLIVYTLTSKLLWKCTYAKALLTNLLWIVLYTILLGYMVIAVVEGIG